VTELERQTNHDVAAFVDAVAETLGGDGRWFHFRLTSSDVLDTALSLTVQEAGALASKGSIARSGRSSTLEEHRETLCMGRTHGVPSTTFSLKLAGHGSTATEHRSSGRCRMRVGSSRASWASTRRSTASRAHRARAARSTRAELDADPSARPSRGASKTSAVVASSLDSSAEIRHLARTEVREVGRCAQPEGIVVRCLTAEPDHG
jgi:adenylosuccinate lyase